MTQLEVWLLGVGLAMDCFTVALAGGIIQRDWKWKTNLLITFLFGFFQGGMTWIGWVCTQYFSDALEAYDHWIAFVLLSYLGGKMIFDGLKNDEEHHNFDPTKLIVILTLAVATSIDALAVGISFTCMGMTTFHSILYPVVIIGLTSSLFAFIGYAIGIYCGKRLHFPVEPIGGAILIAIGCRILFEHLY